MNETHDVLGVERFCLRDGRDVHIRRITGEDAPRLAEFATRLSANALRLRFFTPVRRFAPQMLEHLANVDFIQRAAFVVTFPEKNDLLAVGRYEGETANTAEVAFIVQDELQGNGLATELLQHLVVLARQNGFTIFSAMMLPENTEMLEVFQASGYPLTVTLEGGVERVRLEIA